MSKVKELVFARWEDEQRFQSYETPHEDLIFNKEYNEVEQLTTIR